MQPKYNEDFYGWAITNASLLKQGKIKEADMEHIIEELEEMGSNKENELFSRLALLMSHLLKWHFQPNFRSHSWTNTIKEQRFRIKRVLKKNPGLKGELDETFQDAYTAAIFRATDETGLDEKTFPAQCPYTFEQIMDEEFYPE
jgi:hypothetical protein